MTLKKPRRCRVPGCKDPQVFRRGICLKHLQSSLTVLEALVRRTTGSDPLNLNSSLGASLADYLADPSRLEKEAAERVERENAYQGWIVQFAGENDLGRWTYSVKIGARGKLGAVALASRRLEACYPKILLGVREVLASPDPERTPESFKGSPPQPENA